MNSNWNYRSQEIINIPEGYFGFVYIIHNVRTGQIYVGKKQFQSHRKKVLTKKDKLLPENKRKKFKMVISDSDWRDYYGSSATLKADILLYGKENFYREILCLCRDKTEWTYKEVWYQFYYNVLEVPSYNENILGRFFKKKT